MAACSATFTLLETPLTLAELAVHLATRQNFLLHPCRERALRALEIVAGPYGYDVTFHPEEELARLQYRFTPARCVCEAPGAHLSEAQQLKFC
jgi:hypothetical protein